MKGETFGISVIVPAYNASAWLEKSIPKTDAAMVRADVKQAEFIIVDDGSSDDTNQIAKKLKLHFPCKILSQKNSGRFVARKNGTDEAKYNNILFIDTRVYINPDGIKFLAETIAKQPGRQVWTSHVILNKKSNIYARFWDAITSVAWRRYFSNPRDYSYGLEEFDYFPKGTTCFFVPKDVIKEANSWFANHTKDLKTSNDDTLLIRHIAETNNININPKFSCTYHARTNLRQYIQHVFHRGQVFVDGFLRRDGNRFYYPLVVFLTGCVAVPITLIIWPQFIAWFVLVGVLIWSAEFIALILLGISSQDAMSVVTLTPLFAFVYGAGIWKAFIRLHLLKMFELNTARET